MEILAVLIPVSIVLIGIAVVIFLWAVNHNQFEQLDKHGFDIFEDDSGDQS
jgi:cbb3-type cytochrome oxidase maturation protein